MLFAHKKTLMTREREKRKHVRMGERKGSREREIARNIVREKVFLWQREKRGKCKCAIQISALSCKREEREESG